LRNARCGLRSVAGFWVDLSPVGSASGRCGRTHCIWVRAVPTPKGTRSQLHYRSFDLARLFSQLRRKARMSCQKVTGEFPTVKLAALPRAPPLQTKRQPEEAGARWVWG